MLKWRLRDYPVDQSLFNPIQILLSADTLFTGGAINPCSNRSGLFTAGYQSSEISIPADLESQSASAVKISKPRTQTKLGIIELENIIRNSKTGLVIDGRKQLMFQLSNSVIQKLMWNYNTPLKMN